jgi:hypothetical protein
LAALDKIYAKNFDGLDIKKLKGLANVYRVRKGSIRILFLIKDTGEIKLLDINYRNDNTYYFFILSKHLIEVFKIHFTLLILVSKDLRIFLIV